MMKSKAIIVLFMTGYIFCAHNAKGQNQAEIKIIESGKDFSIRGISVPQPGVVWISGSNGTAGVSRDTGMSYNLMEINNYKDLDFRDIHAFNDAEALVMNSGSPAYILKTINGGKSWKEVYTNSHKNIFFNGMDFWDKQHGIAFSDPIDGNLFIITTHDGGETWQVPDSISIPGCGEGEAGFAASGTGIYCHGDKKVIIGTGGNYARLFISDDRGINWRTSVTPMVSNKPSTGIFSVAMTDNGKIHITGGDYKNEKDEASYYYYTDDEGFTWLRPESGPAGYRSCLLAAETRMAVTGPGGTDISEDEGKTWQKLKEGFNAIATCDECRYYHFAGMAGKTGMLLK